MQPVQTVFIGTSSEGASTLKTLHKHPLFTVCAVITQPEKPAGRDKEPQTTPIHDTATLCDIPIYTPETSTDTTYTNILDTYDPELAIVISFGQFLPKPFITAPRYACINVHYSILPFLRGAVPVQKAILEGHTETGVTIQVMEETMDTGPILAQTVIPIAENDTTPSLKEKLIPLGESLLITTLTEWISGQIKPREQNHNNATYCYTSDITKQKAEILWNGTKPQQIERMIRALLPWPVAWTTLPNGKKLKIYSAKLEQKTSEHNIDPKNPGDILDSKTSLYFATSDKNTILNAQTVQQEGKKRMSGATFRQGITL